MRSPKFGNFHTNQRSDILTIVTDIDFKLLVKHHLKNKLLITIQMYRTPKFLGVLHNS